MFLRKLLPRISYNSIIYSCKSFYFTFLLKFAWFFLCKQYFSTFLPERNNFLVSLTSFRNRFEALDLTLMKLILVCPKGTNIVVNLYEDDWQDSEKIRNKFEKFAIFFNKVSKNYKSYLKLIPTMSTFPNKNIFTVDDDVIYSKRFMGKMCFLANQVNLKYIIGCRAVLVNESDFYINWVEVVEQGFFNRDGFVTGVGGVIYPASWTSFTDQEMKFAMQLCSSNDDIWFHFKRQAHKIPLFICNTRFRKINNWPHSQEIALWRTNVTKGVFDEHYKAAKIWFSRDNIEI